MESGDVPGFRQRKIGKDLFAAGACGQQIEQLPDADAETPQAGPLAARWRSKRIERRLPAQGKKPTGVTPSAFACDCRLRRPVLPHFQAMLRLVWLTDP